MSKCTIKRSGSVLTLIKEVKGEYTCYKIVSTAAGALLSGPWDYYKNALGDYAKRSAALANWLSN